MVIEKTHIRADGPPDAPVVVLVHGLGASSRSWDLFVPVLTTTHRVLRVDLPGHGGSAAPADGDHGMAASARRIGGALDRIGVDAAVVVGHSTGGLVAVALAEQRPEHVRGLGLINTGPALDALIAPDIVVEPSRWPHLSNAQIRAAMAAAFSRPDYVIPQQLVDDVRLVTYEAFTRTEAASHDYLRERTLPARLGALALPTQVIVGEDDRRWRSSSARAYEAVASVAWLSVRARPLADARGPGPRRRAAARLPA